MGWVWKFPLSSAVRLCREHAGLDIYFCHQSCWRDERVLSVRNFPLVLNKRHMLYLARTLLVYRSLSILRRIRLLKGRGQTGGPGLYFNWGLKVGKSAFLGTLKLWGIFRFFYFCCFSLASTLGYRSEYFAYICEIKMRCDRGRNGPPPTSHHFKANLVHTL